ncbi:hypothetical protein OIU78_029059 [Salix suchowensis]|nr:hypothetical protein OIU78_029059 [Salix suchowensis]
MGFSGQIVQFEGVRVRTSEKIDQDDLTDPQMMELEVDHLSYPSQQLEIRFHFAMQQPSPFPLVELDEKLCLPR